MTNRVRTLLDDYDPDQLTPSPRDSEPPVVADLFDPIEDELEDEAELEEDDDATDAYVSDGDWRLEVSPTDVGGIDMRKLDLYIG